MRNRIYPSSGIFLPRPGSVMYDRARDNGCIPYEEEFLLKTGDRQDFRANRTSMPDQQSQPLVLDGLDHVDQALKIGLDQRAVVKTTTCRPAPK